MKNEIKAKIAFGELTLKEAFRAVKDRCGLIIVNDDDRYHIFREEDGYLRLYAEMEGDERWEYAFLLKQKVKLDEDGSVVVPEEYVTLAFKETKTINLLAMALQEAT